VVYHTDGLGSVRAITETTSPNALVIQTYRTDEFGIPDPSGTMGASTQPMQYTGEQRDAESNFMDLRARLHDPTIGRFMQGDPLRKSGPVSAGGTATHMPTGPQPSPRTACPSDGYGSLGPRSPAPWDSRTNKFMTYCT
jgi:RHS repeat-associated protein